MSKSVLFPLALVLSAGCNGGASGVALLGGGTHTTENLRVETIATDAQASTCRATSPSTRSTTTSCGS